nr:HNH endonuclease domain-containing protein [uncultured Faecalibacillus sp.]
MNNYIKQWLEVIKNMNTDNTYKLAWSRAIIELCFETSQLDKQVTFTFQHIVKKMIKYYWNQTYFFHLDQSPNKKKIPVLVQNVNHLIELYESIQHTHTPVWFDKAETVLKHEKQYYKIISESAKTLKNDFSWRFKLANNKEYNLYYLDKNCMFISLTKQQVLLLKEYSFVLSQLINFKWTQLLEKFNHSPRIASKVKGISDNTIKRSSLAKYKNILLKSNNYQAIDFYIGKVLKENDISVDHVIPWSFMYSDDIWNLVLTRKSNNSSKSNSIPSQTTIESLKERNSQLVNLISDSKYKDELLLAIENDYVDKFYLAMKI